MPKPQITDANFSSIFAWNKLKKEVLNPWTPQTWTLLKKNPNLSEYSMRKTYTTSNIDESKRENKRENERKSMKSIEKSFHLEKSELLLGFFK